jgi:hypothetical protein
MGVAYFYKANYRLASHYFQKAIDLNVSAAEDDFFAELFHLSLVYSQRNDFAMDIPLPAKSNVDDPMIRNTFTLVAGGGKMINYDHSRAEKTPNSDFSELR